MKNQTGLFIVSLFLFLSANSYANVMYKCGCYTTGKNGYTYKKAEFFQNYCYVYVNDIESVVEQASEKCNSDVNEYERFYKHKWSTYPQYSNWQSEIKYCTVVKSRECDDKYMFQEANPFNND